MAPELGGALSCAGIYVSSERERSPRTAATAKPRSTVTSKRSGPAGWSSRAGAAPAPPAGLPSASSSFRTLVNWRAGSEARISCLKRDYGWRRTLTDGETGATTWCSWGVLAHNATKISALALDAERQRAGPTGSARRRAAAA
jgi:hypothetical protein